jgi:hypothetical protein
VLFAIAIAAEAVEFLSRKSGISGTPTPSPAGRQSDEIAPLVMSGRLSGEPIGCGTSLSRLTRAATLDSSGIAVRAKFSAPRLASSWSGQDCRGMEFGARR